MTASIAPTPTRSRFVAIRRGMDSRASHRATIAALVGAGWAVCAARASADDAQPVPVAYDAPAQCPSAGDFLDMVAADGGRLVRALDAQPARSFALHVGGAGPFAGRLVVRDADGTEATREVNGARCDDVVRSLAVLVALLLQPPSSTPSAAEAPASSPPEPEAVPSPPVAGIAASIPEVTVSPGGSAPDDEAPAAVRPLEGWRLDVSGGATLNTGAAPSLDPGLAAYVELLDEAPSFLAPSIRLGAAIDADQSLPSSVTVRRMVGRLDACSLRAVLTRPWSDDAFTLQSCVRVDVGRLDVEESQPWAATHARRLWVAPAMLLRLRWTSPRYFVEIEGGASFPLLRERFSVGAPLFGTSADFEVPGVALATGLGFGAFIL